MLPEDYNKVSGNKVEMGKKLLLWKYLWIFMTKFAIDNINNVGGMGEGHCMQLPYLIIKQQHWCVIYIQIVVFLILAYT
jgi:hypothetical protein